MKKSTFKTTPRKPKGDKRGGQTREQRRERRKLENIATRDPSKNNLLFQLDGKWPEGEEKEYADFEEVVCDMEPTIVWTTRGEEILTWQDGVCNT